MYTDTNGRPIPSWRDDEYPTFGLLWRILCGAWMAIGLVMLRLGLDGGLVCIAIGAFLFALFARPVLTIIAVGLALFPPLTWPVAIVAGIYLVYGLIAVYGEILTLCLLALARTVRSLSLALRRRRTTSLCQALSVVDPTGSPPHEET